MTQELEIDIDGERIKLDGRWMTHTDIETEIKARVNAGNYHVANLSLALQSLEANLASVETIELKMPNDMYQAFLDLGVQNGSAPEYLMRRAMVEFLAQHHNNPGGGRSKTAPIME